MVFCWWLFITTLVLKHHDWFCIMSAFISLGFVFWMSYLWAFGKKATVPIYNWCTKFTHIQNLQGLGKIRRRVEVSIHQHRGGGTCHEKTKVWSAEVFVWYGDLLLAFYNYHGLVAPRFSLYNFWFHTYSVCFCVQGVFPAALPYTVYLVRRPQYLFTRSC